MKIKRLVAFMMVSAAISPVSALEKPKTIEDMWKIIQIQQQQIEEMKARLQAVPPAQTAAPANIGQAEQPPSGQTAVQTLERKTDVLSREVEKLRTNLTIPEEPKYKSAYGLGPAASKVYQVGKGLSIGGYGEAIYQDYVADKAADSKNNADLERAVLYVGYKFSDHILFNSELEFEHATTGEGAEEKGEVSVEFAAMDFFIDPHANIRTGLVLMPMGFINQIHEPPFFFGNHRPEVEQRILPSTWREMGLGLFGQIAPGLTYTTYLVNGLDAKGFSAEGIREGRGGGSQAKAEDFGYVGRMDYVPASLPGLTIGGSLFVGNSGQNQLFAGQKADVFTQIYEGHLQWKYRGWEFRGLGSWGSIGNAGLLTQAARAADGASGNELIGSQNYGWYTELGYDILPLFKPETLQYLAPFFRYEAFNTLAALPVGYTADGSLDQRIYQFGLQYKPIPNVVIKADYRNRTARTGSVPDDFNLGFGFIF